MNVISTLLQVLMIINAFIIVTKQDNLRLIIFFSVFSLITASLYFFNNAPDVALAEVAIGCAITPLIFIVSISRQKNFIVINDTEDDYFSHSLAQPGEGYKFLQSFAKQYKLKLTVYHRNGKDKAEKHVNKNVDLVIAKCPKNNSYVIRGKGSSILINKLEQIVTREPLIQIVKTCEGDSGE